MSFAVKRHTSVAARIWNSTDVINRQTSQKAPPYPPIQALTGVEKTDVGKRQTSQENTCDVCLFRGGKAQKTCVIFQVTSVFFCCFSTSVFSQNIKIDRRQKQQKRQTSAVPRPDRYQQQQGTGNAGDPCDVCLFYYFQDDVCRF